MNAKLINNLLIMLYGITLEQAQTMDFPAHDYVERGELRWKTATVVAWVGVFDQALEAQAMHQAMNDAFRDDPVSKAKGFTLQ